MVDGRRCIELIVEVVDEDVDGVVNGWIRFIPRYVGNSSNAIEVAVISWLNYSDSQVPLLGSSIIALMPAVP